MRSLVRSVATKAIVLPTVPTGTVTAVAVAVCWRVWAAPPSMLIAIATLVV